MAGKQISFWLAERALQHAEREGSTPLDQLAAICAHSYVLMLRQFDEHPLVMTQEQAESLYQVGQRHLETWASLRTLSAAAGTGRVLNRNLWMIVPKLHHLKHCLEDAKANRINPNMQNLLAAESWVGAVGRMARIPVGPHIFEY